MYNKSRNSSQNEALLVKMSGYSAKSDIPLRIEYLHGKEIRDREYDVKNRRMVYRLEDGSKWHRYEGENRFYPSAQPARCARKPQNYAYHMEKLLDKVQSKQNQILADFDRRWRNEIDKRNIGPIIQAIAMEFKRLNAPYEEARAIEAMRQFETQGRFMIARYGVSQLEQDLLEAAGLGNLEKRIANAKYSPSTTSYHDSDYAEGICRKAA